MLESLGIRREDHSKWERRVPLIPEHIKDLIRSESISISIQSSSKRIFKDRDYKNAGGKIKEELLECPLIFGVKEIPEKKILDNKIYVIFSHTIKGQSENMGMLKKMMEKKCTLIDYEKMTNNQGKRIVFFGSQAGQAGIVDAFSILGKKLNKQFIKNPFDHISQTFKYNGLSEIKTIFKDIGREISEKGFPRALRPFICGFLGYGRVSLGAQEILDFLPVETIQPEELISFVKKNKFDSNKIYKVIFKEKDLVKNKDLQIPFNLQEYYDHPEKYDSKFDTYLPYLTLLMNCIYWDKKYPRFVTKKDLQLLWEKSDVPSLLVIGDISCDIDGSIEITHKCTDIENPAFVYNPLTGNYSDDLEDKGIAVLAVDNFPAEIPYESSLFFSQALKPLIPKMMKADFNHSFENCNLPNEIKKAVILFQGKLTPDFSYMKSFL